MNNNNVEIDMDCKLGGLPTGTWTAERPTDSQTITRLVLTTCHAHNLNVYDEQVAVEHMTATSGSFRVKYGINSEKTLRHVINSDLHDDDPDSREGFILFGPNEELKWSDLLRVLREKGGTPPTLKEGT